MSHSHELLAKRKAHAFPTQIPYYEKPLQLVKASGSYVWDEDGKAYLDAIGGIVTISVGHNHPRIKNKLMDLIQNDAIQHTTHLYLNQHREELLAKISTFTPSGMDRCYLTNSGSEANELAILNARVATGEETIISLRHSYHGGTQATLNLCGHSAWKFKSQSPSAVTHAVAPYCYRCPFQLKPTNCQLECADDVKEVIETTTHGKIAGIIIEPILGVGGFIDPPIEYHKKVYDIVKQFGGMYISDEVQTGVGRTGKSFFAISDSNVTPDFITMAKGFGNGAPIGAMITNNELAMSLQGKIHFLTFAGDPYQSAQALETLLILEDEKLIQNAHDRGALIKDALLDMQNEFPIMGDVRGRGLILGVELVTDPESKNPATQQCLKFLEIAKNQGLLLGKGGLHGNVLRIAPSLALSYNEAKEFLSKFHTCLRLLNHC